MAQSSTDVGSILSNLLKRIFFENNINPNRFHYYLTKYLEDPINGVPQNKKDFSSQRGNYIKEINKPSITWLVFIRGLRIINVSKFTISINIHRDFGSDTTHSLTVDLGKSNPKVDEESDVTIDSLVERRD